MSPLCSTDATMHASICRCYVHTRSLTIGTCSSNVPIVRSNRNNIRPCKSICKSKDTKRWSMKTSKSFSKNMPMETWLAVVITIPTGVLHPHPCRHRWRPSDRPTRIIRAHPHRKSAKQLQRSLHPWWSNEPRQPRRLAHRPQPCHRSPTMSTNPTPSTIKQLANSHPCNRRHWFAACVIMLLCRKKDLAYIYFNMHARKVIFSIDHCWLVPPLIPPRNSWNYSMEKWVRSPMDRCVTIDIYDC